MRTTPQNFLHITRIALPIILSFVLLTSIELADSVMSGRVGPIDLASISLGKAVYGLFVFGALGYFSVISGFIGNFLGAGKIERFPGVVQSALIQAALLALGCSILMNIAPLLLPLFEIEVKVLDKTTDYIFWLSLGLPANFINIVLLSFLAGVRNTLPGLIFTFFTLLINIFLNWVFIYGNLGSTAYGGPGAGIASMLAIGLETCMILLYIHSKRNDEKYRIFNWRFGSSSRDGRSILRIGSPAGASALLEAGLFSIAGFMAGSFGAYKLAAHQISLNFSSLTFVVGLGISSALTVCVSYEIGRGDKKEAKRVGLTGIAMAVIWMSFTALCMLLFNKDIVRIYTNDAGLIELAASLLVYAAIFQLSDGLQIASSGALKGYGDTKFTMCGNTISYFIFGLPLCWFLSHSFGYGIYGLWIGMIVALTLSAGLNFGRYLYRSSNLRHF